MKRISFFGAAALICVACGGSSDEGGSGGSAGGGTGGSAGSSTGGSAGSGTGGSAGSSTGGAAGTGTGGSAGSSTGGAAGTGTGGTAGSGGQPGDAGVCPPLQQEMQKTLEAATACNPAISSIQCDGSATSPDTCGCPVLLNEKTPDKVKAAQAAYKAWTDAGCGPFPCGKACFAGTTGSCNPTTSTCQWKAP